MNNVFEFTWIISFVSLFIIVFIFSMIFIKLKKMGEIERQKDSLSSLVANYKPQYFYWEYIVFLRRICIAMFTASTTDNNNYKMVFILIMFIFLFYQNRYQPFIINTINMMESILLSCLIFIIVLELAYS